MLALLLVATFASRLAIGLHTPLDGDEATVGLTALRVTHGHLVLMSGNSHYLGALEVYILAPFVWLFGTTLAAIRIPMALLGAAYVAGLYDLGITMTRSRARGLLLAAAGSVFPLFELSWTIKARNGYAETMLLAVLCLSAAARIGWRESPNRTRNWALLGLLAGLALWNDLQIGVVLIVIVAALLCRAPALGWGTAARGAAVAASAAVVGFSPWLAYNLTHHFASPRHLPNVSTSIGHALRGLASRELPVFFGSASSCGHNTVSPWFADLALLALAGAVVWTRRRTLAHIVRGRLAALEPVDMVLAIAPVALISVTVGRFNGASCEPRYLLPLAIPLALGASLVLASRLPWRMGALTALAGYLVIAPITAWGPTVDSSAQTLTGVKIPNNARTTAQALERLHVAVVFGDYWLIRPIAYYGAEWLLVGINPGPAAFPDLQAQALGAEHPSWLFVDGDPMISRFSAALRRHGVTASEIRLGRYTLFRSLSAPVPLSDI